MLQRLNYSDIIDALCEISDNGDMYGYDRYDRDANGESGYYRDYEELFSELAGGAYQLWETLQDSDLADNWNDMAVALLGAKQRVLGFDAVEMDYFAMIHGHEEDWAVEEATKRIERLNKHDLIKCFRGVLTVLTCYFDIKAAHDCLTSIVQELDEKGAILERKNDEINWLYKDLTGKNEDQFDAIIAQIPQRMWVE